MSLTRPAPVRPLSGSCSALTEAPPLSHIAVAFGGSEESGGGACGVWWAWFVQQKRLGIEETSPKPWRDLGQGNSIGVQWAWKLKVCLQLWPRFINPRLYCLCVLASEYLSREQRVRRFF